MNKATLFRQLIAAPKSRFFRVTLFVAGCVFFGLTASAHAATYYIDYAGGNNSNNGTSTSTPWKSQPYMTNAAGRGGALPTYPLDAGDHFILKGGETWPNPCFPIVPLGPSGDGSHIDY